MAKTGGPGVGGFTNCSVGANTKRWGKHPLGITPTFFARFRRSIQLVRQDDVFHQLPGGLPGAIRL